MPTVSTEELVHRLHSQTMRFVVAVTGGGSGAIASLLSSGGASRSILAATVPYAPPALVEWLGGKPDAFCSDPTARAMAMAAFLKAKKYDPAAWVAGVSCTASLASDRPKRGPHRAHLAFQTATNTATVALDLKKGARTRGQEEALVSALVLNHLAAASSIDARLDIPLLDDERIESAGIVGSGDQQALLAGRVLRVLSGSPLGERKAESAEAIFPGAFHPLHEGHRQMARIARRVLGQPVAFELSIDNVDKPPLDFIEIDRRARQFAADEPLWLSRAPTFVEKAAIFPGATFVVGADTIARIGRPRYYAHDERAMQAALARIGEFGCAFLVFGRLVEGRFCTLAELELPAALARLCREVPASEFRDDISSTELRARQPSE